MTEGGILLLFHCGANTGYAIGPLEEVLYESALRLTGHDPGRVHLAYKHLDRGMPENLPVNPDNVARFDYYAADSREHREMRRRVDRHGIRCAVAFDLPVRAPAIDVLRSAGVRTLIAYHGAPISSINRGLKLWLKRIDVALAGNRPDHFVFESEGMRRTATHGRGIPERQTSVVRLGVDTERFSGPPESTTYAHDVFEIPERRHIFFYSGHTSPRKGLDVVMRAAVELASERERSDFHFLLVGNKPGEEDPYLALVEGTPAADHVTFGGYRDDIEKLHRSCSAAVIASTGWDSFTVSAAEMASSGLPLLVSRLPGLEETVIEGRTGLLFPPGDSTALARHVAHLLNRPGERIEMGRAGRRRALREFSRENQIEELVRIIGTVHRS